jgi:hypothetical protein
MSGRQKRARLRVVGSLGQITMPSETRALQAAIKADLESIRTSLQRCATAGTFSPEKTPGDWDAWQGMKTRAENYVKEDASFLSSLSQFERGQTLQKELASWHGKARALGCDAGDAPSVTEDKPSVFSFGGLSTTALLVLAAAFLMRKK